MLTETNLLSIEHVAFTYGKRQILRDVNFTLKAGESILLLGQNGAGKTTLLACLLGMLKPQAGTIRHEKSGLRYAGFLGEPPLIPELNAWQQIELELELRFGKLRSTTWKQELEYYCQLLSLSLEELTKKTRQCSTGNRKKIAIAKALLCKPDVLILDEPASGLDPASIVSLRDALIRIRHESGISMIVSSHQIAESRKVASRAIVLHDGRLVRSIDLDSINETRWAAGFSRSLAQHESNTLTQMTIFNQLHHPNLGTHCDFIPIVPPHDILKQLLQIGLPVERFGPVSDQLEQTYLACLETEHES